MPRRSNTPESDEQVTLVLEEHFSQKEVEPMNTRTMAFQIDEALFQRIKTHLTRTGVTQRAFMIGLIEQALAAAEREAAEESAPVQDEDGDEPMDEGIGEAEPEASAQEAQSSEPEPQSEQSDTEADEPKDDSAE